MSESYRADDNPIYPETNLKHADGRCGVYAGRPQESAAGAGGRPA
jgi:hypothetical protein